MGKVHFSDDFKRDAVLQITDRGYPVNVKCQLARMRVRRNYPRIDEVTRSLSFMHSKSGCLESSHSGHPLRSSCFSA